MFGFFYFVRACALDLLAHLVPKLSLDITYDMTSSLTTSKCGLHPQCVLFDSSHREHSFLVW
jgi:hypothetical protein